MSARKIPPEVAVPHFWLLVLGFAPCLRFTSAGGEGAKPSAKLTLASETHPCRCISDIFGVRGVFFCPLSSEPPSLSREGAGGVPLAKARSGSGATRRMR